MHTAVVIVPLGLCLEFFRGLKLLGDTGTAGFCVECRL